MLGKCSSINFHFPQNCEIFDLGTCRSLCHCVTEILISVILETESHLLTYKSSGNRYRFHFEQISLSVNQFNREKLMCLDSSACRLKIKQLWSFRIKGSYIKFSVYGIEVQNVCIQSCYVFIGKSLTNQFWLSLLKKFVFFLVTV